MRAHPAGQWCSTRGWSVQLVSRGDAGRGTARGDIANSIGSFWELVEWWTTLGVASDVGVAFLGSQGDVWDAQWDMFLVLVGAIVGIVAFTGVHDRSMARVSSI